SCFLLQILYFYNSDLSVLALPSSSDTPTTYISTLSLHDALPISSATRAATAPAAAPGRANIASARGRQAPTRGARGSAPGRSGRSEEHTSELQSLTNLVCRLLLEKKKYIN